jgi:hypothetical protein
LRSSAPSPRSCSPHPVLVRPADHAAQSRHRHGRAVLHVGAVYAIVPLAAIAVGLHALAATCRRAAQVRLGGGAMTALMFTILGAWFVSLFVGPSLYAAMGSPASRSSRSSAYPGIVIPQKVAMAANSFPLLAAPLFILMGNVMNSAGISYRIFDFAKAVVGWMRGGLCHANIVGSVIFAGMSGSRSPTRRASAPSRSSDEERRLRRRDRRRITAASATIGPSYPPSLPMIVYGVAAETSIGAVHRRHHSGLLMAVALMVMVRRIAIRRNLPRHPWQGWGELWIASAARSGR